MTDRQKLESAIESGMRESIQNRATGKIEGGSGYSLFNYIVTGGYLIPPWWSQTRDVELRKFWKDSDHLSGAIYNMTSKMTAIPFRIVPSDPSNSLFREQALFMQETLSFASEYGDGWQGFYNKFIEDLLTQDNGAFAEIIAPGSKTKPISGAPLGVAHLDSARCQRTGDPMYPVLFRDSDGKLRKLHYTRVMMTSQMPSPIQEMFGVGFSAVSRCISVAQTLKDVLIYKQEKLGSRPLRAILVTKGGLDPDDVAESFQAASTMMDSQGMSRYAKIVVMGNSAIPDAGLDIVELASLPEGFDEETSIVFGMATIALALGVDARELFPAMSAGATRADALLQHIKQRGKGPGQIIGTVEQLFNFKFLPPHLKFEFDMQDDAEDRQGAEIAATRSQSRERDIVSKTIDIRTARQKMVKDGEITESQFEALELEDGRLPSGESVLSLIYSDEKESKKFLSFSVESPDDILANERDVMMKEISTNRSKINKELANVVPHDARMKLLRVQKALDKLEYLYKFSEVSLLPQGEQIMEDAENGELETGDNNLPASMMGDRMRRENPLSPNDGQELDSRNSMRPNNDDAEKDTKMLKAINDAMDRVEYALGNNGIEVDYENMIEGEVEYGGQIHPISYRGTSDQGEKGLNMFRKRRKDSQGVDVSLPIMTSGPVFQPVIRLNVPQQQPNVNVTVDTKELTDLVKSAQNGRVDVDELTQIISALSRVVSDLKAKENPAPIVNVNVPEQPAPVVNVNPVLEMPDVEETTDVVHDADGRVKRMVKRITKLVGE